MVMATTLRTRGLLPRLVLYVGTLPVISSEQLHGEPIEHFMATDGICKRRCAPPTRVCTSSSHVPRLPAPGEHRQIAGSDFRSRSAPPPDVDEDMALTSMDMVVRGH